MSGLAAGIRLAMYDRRVCILERHYAFGGLNSYYTLNGREYDVGLHALTNYVPAGVRTAPLPRVLRQLRLTREDFDLCPQRGSLVQFPSCRLRFTNDIAVLIDEVAAAFPAEVDGLRRLIEVIDARAYDHVDFGHATARQVLPEYIRDPLLIDMLLCPLMYYGSPTEHDMDFALFAILFRSVFCEGFARPRDGVRTIIKALVRRFRACGGKLRMNCGVERIEVHGDRAAALTLSTGETLTADQVYSCAGYFETMRLCSDAASSVPPAGETGHMSFVESVSILDTKPAALGLDSTIIFFNAAERFTYARPDEAMDDRSGVICCPNNYERHEDLPDGIVRVTCLADHARWSALAEANYQSAKEHAYQRMLDRLAALGYDVAVRVVEHDIFTPRTIERFTGHIGGAVYGAPVKSPAGTTRLKNLFLCGTDQGLLGIIGALLSGVLMANRHGLEGD